MPQIESPGFGCGAGAPVIPTESCAIVITKSGEPVRLHNTPPDQVKLWMDRGDNYAHVGESLLTGATILIFPSDFV